MHKYSEKCLLQHFFIAAVIVAHWGGTTIGDDNGSHEKVLNKIFDAFTDICGFTPRQEARARDTD